MYSWRDRSYEGEQFHFEIELLAAVALAFRGGIQFDVLHANVRKGIFEIGEEPAKVMIIRGAAHVEQRRAVRKLRKDAYFRRQLAAKLRNLHPVVRTEIVQRLDQPRIHVIRSSHGRLAGLQ